MCVISRNSVLMKFPPDKMSISDMSLENRGTRRGGECIQLRAGSEKIYILCR